MILLLVSAPAQMAAEGPVEERRQALALAQVLAAVWGPLWFLASASWLLALVWAPVSGLVPVPGWVEELVQV
jgi:hypothetical protein